MRTATAFLAMVAAGALAAPAAAQVTAWPERIDRKPLSARALKLTEAFHYPTPAESTELQRELDACRAPADNPGYCIDVVFALANVFTPEGKARIDAALAAVDAVYPVDPDVLLADRRLPRGDVAAALRALKAAADRLDSEAYQDPCGQARRSLAFAATEWRAGGFALVHPDQIERACGPSSREHAIALNLSAVSNASLYDTAVPEALAALRKSRSLRVAGDGETALGTAVVTANLGMVEARAGDFTAAQSLLRAAHERFASAGPARLDEARATALALARVLGDRGRTRDAAAFARLALDGYRSDKATPPDQLAQALAVQGSYPLAPEQGPALLDEAIALDRRLILDTAPTGYARYVAAMTAAFGKSFSDMDMFKANVEQARDALTTIRKRRLATTLVARANLALGARDPATAGTLAAEAKGLDFFNYHAPIIEAAAALALGKTGQVESLLAGAMNYYLPPDHPDRVLRDFLATYYYLYWNARYAPAYARRATELALRRMQSGTSYSPEAEAEMKGFGPLFRLQVRANWEAARLPPRDTRAPPSRSADLSGSHPTCVTPPVSCVARYGSTLLRRKNRISSTTSGDRSRLPKSGRIRRIGR